MSEEVESDNPDAGGERAKRVKTQTLKRFSKKQSLVSGDRMYRGEANHPNVLAQPSSEDIMERAEPRGVKHSL